MTIEKKSHRTPIRSAQVFQVRSYKESLAQWNRNQLHLFAFTLTPERRNRPILIPPGATKIVDTGTFIKLPDDLDYVLSTAGNILTRGLAIFGYTVDDIHGKILIHIHNATPTSHYITTGEALATLHLLHSPTLTAQIEELSQ